jgi:hypothetical protein
LPVGDDGRNDPADDGTGDAKAYDPLKRQVDVPTVRLKQRGLTAGVPADRQEQPENGAAKYPD